MGDWPLVLAGVGLGLLGGPGLAALTLTAPTEGRLLPAGWWRGRPATRSRIATVSGLAAVTLAALAAAIGPSAAVPAFLVLGAVGVVLAVVDGEHHRLPDRLTGSGFAIGAALLLGAAAYDGVLGAWVRALLAAALAGCAFLLLALVGRGGLGLGDVKLAGLLGLYLGWLGWGHLVTGLVLGFVVGAVVALALVVTRRAGLRTPVAFGPSLLLGALLATAVGPVLSTG